jgi:hypothetical protein
MAYGGLRGAVGFSLVLGIDKQQVRTTVNNCDNENHTVSWWIRKLNCIEERPRFFFSIQLKIKFKNLNWLQLNLN